MIEELKRAGRLELTQLLAGMAVFCFALSVFRYSVTHSRLFLFLNWNLFLAFLPWAASTFVVLKSGLRKNRAAMAVMILAWILFFPNSPYILTDLFHLQERRSIPMWFDLVLNPFSHSRTWGVTLFMGALLNMMFWTIKMIKRSQ